MNKINKLSIPITIITASILLGGFYYATQTSKQKTALANNIKCQQDGFKLFEKDKEELRDYESYNSAPHFKFINELNTCLYAGVLYSDLPASYASYYFIKDVYTNIEIASRDSYEMKDGSGYKSINNTSEYNDLYYKYFLK